MTQHEAVHPTDDGFPAFFADLLVGLRRSVALQPFHLVPCRSNDLDHARADAGVEVEGYVLTVVHCERDQHSSAGRACRKALHHWCEQAVRDGWRFWSMGLGSGRPQFQFLDGEAVLVAVHAADPPILFVMPSPECAGTLHLSPDFGFAELVSCLSPRKDVA